MIDRDVLAGKLDAIRHHVARIRASGALDHVKFATDQVLQDATLFNLVQATQAAVDVGAMIIAARGFETPTSLGHTFAVLGAHGVLDRTLSEHLSALAGLRNLLVHRYGVVDLERVHRDLADDLEALDRLVALLARSSGGPDPGAMT